MPFDLNIKRSECRLPIVPAADTHSSIEVEFDQHQGEMLKEEARQRALNSSKTPDRDFRNHLMGLASEVAVATWRGGIVDRRIFDDYDGDSGVDVIAPGGHREGNVRYQVKATRKVSDPRRTVTQEEVDKADVFVLCRTTAPNHLIKIIGCIRSYQLESMNTIYGKNGYVLRPEILESVGQKHYGPDDVREVIQNQPSIRL